MGVGVETLRLRITIRCPWNPMCSLYTVPPHTPQPYNYMYLRDSLWQSWKLLEREREREREERIIKEETEKEGSGKKKGGGMDI